MEAMADQQAAGAASPPEQHPAQELQGAPSSNSAQTAAHFGTGQWRDREDLPDAPYRLLHSLEAHGGQAVTAVQFDAAGHCVASAGADGTAAIWDARTGRLLQRLTGHKGGLSGGRWQALLLLVGQQRSLATLAFWLLISWQSRCVWPLLGCRCCMVARWPLPGHRRRRPHRAGAPHMLAAAPWGGLCPPCPARQSNRCCEVLLSRVVIQPAA